MSVYNIDGMVDPPEVGTHRGVPFDVYRSWDAMNASALVWGTISMKHLRGYLDGQIAQKSSKDLNFGSALHCAVLEPDLFDERYEISRPCEAPLKSGNRAGQDCGCSASFKSGGQWYCGKHAGDFAEPAESFVTPEEHARILAAMESLRNHPAVRLVRQHGGFESSLVWEWNGIKCKSRLDKEIPPGGKCPPTIVDLKKVQVGKATTREVEAAIANWDYHIKMSFYALAYKAIYGEMPNIVFVFIEDNFPFDINVKALDADSLKIGLFEVEKTLLRYLDCMESGSWPGVSYDEATGREDISGVGLRDYVKRGYADVLNHM